MNDAPTQPASAKPQGPISQAELLPPVAPPSGAFVLQLFVIPLAIVSIIFALWFAFSWLAHMGNDPQDIVADLGDLNEESWRRALTLANLLHNAEYDHLKDDSAMAGKLAEVLSKELATPATDDARVQLRLFLCRALGEFRVADGLPALVQAATLERTPKELDVRWFALQALAALAENAGPEALQSNAEVLAALDKAAGEFSDNVEEQTPRERLRSTAAFTLGVLGGQPALDRLVRMLGDASANVRYNAANGLARQGDARAVPALVEMLEPANAEAVASETKADAQNWKQGLVATNALRAALQLAAKNPSLDRAPLIAAMERLRRDLPAVRDFDRLRLDAQEAALLLRK